MRALLIGLMLYSWGVGASLQEIKDTIHKMAIHQADMHRNISILNDQLGNLVLDIRAHRAKLDPNTSAQVVEIFKENATLFRVLQDYYAHNDALFDYLEGVLQGYRSIARDMSSSAPLQKLMPLMSQILTQLQTMVVLEKHLDTLTN
ncbi:hypothetical protein [Helicobacter labacensis]|uniref:hypothetical protein n=1 Tax=Helicobacter labacensis TaxID=2316079 RepID=UPI000EACF484|nr:hypothetical protein [Helicobacter labacensis]